MINNKLDQFLQDLTNLNLSGKVGYAIAKNRRIIEQEIETLSDTVKPHKDFNTFEAERIELAKKYAKKDERGQEVLTAPDSKGQTAYVLENKEAFEAEFTTLKETHKVAIENRKKQIEAYNNLLEEEANIELFTITEDQIPETATANEVYTLLKLVK